MSDTCMNHIEAHWQRLTVANNELFDKGDFENALNGYKEALYRAEVLNNHISDCLRMKIPFVQVYIISCNNLANTYEELGNLEEAQKMLQRVVYYLLHLSGNKAVDKNELHSELKKATINCTRFSDEKTDTKITQKKLIRDVKEELIEHDLLKIG